MAAVKQVLVPLAPGFEEIEAVAVIDLLRRAQITVTVAGVDPGPIVGRTGITIVPDAVLIEVVGREYDLVVLPGGAAGAERLKREPALAALLRRTAEAKRLVAAICAAPTVLAAAGLLHGRRVTSHPSVKDQLVGVHYHDEPIVVDDVIVTSRGPGTAVAFGLALVELLQGAAIATELRRSVLAG